MRRVVLGGTDDASANATVVEAVALVAEPKPSDAQASSAILEVRARDSNQSRGQESVVLVRISNLPQTSVQRATLALFLEPTAAPAGMTSLAVTCNAFSTPWDKSAATWLQAAPGKPWQERELDRGGRCVSYLPPAFTVQDRRRTWDVTEAVADAVKEGKREINLLLRVDYTGHYVAGRGLRFCGTDWKQPGERPQQVLIAK